VIVLGRGIWSRTLAELRSCGQARRECVAYWTGPIAEPSTVDEVEHPQHTATLGSYELDPAWLHEFWVLLHRRQREVRVQVHTHASIAFHSHTDDKWPIVHTPGFLSLVIPNFATRFDVTELFLAEIDTAGVWQQRVLHAAIAGLPLLGVDP
jgi:hypothetical protein